jgi:hypothetical protein
MKTAFSVLVFVCTGAGSFGQGSLQITFDGPPAVAPGTAIEVTNYFESGMFFRPKPGFYGFGRRGPTTDPGWPNNGTAFIEPGSGSLVFSFTNGSTFNLVSVDLAGYSSVVPDITAQFVGYRADGSTVTTNVERNGLTFDTFFFDEGFTNLTRVEMPQFGSLDNLIVEPLAIIPLPPALAIELIWSSAVAQRQTRQVRLLWPTNAGDHQLLTGTNLASANWSAVSPLPVLLGTNNVVTNDLVGPQRFYRLGAP